MSGSHPVSTPPSRLALIDALKALGSQFIVLHHLAFYGPMSDYTHELMPAVVEWFSQQGRLAVQIFIVVAGFLAARSLAPRGQLAAHQPARVLWQRFLRIVLPFMLALGVSALCSDVASHLMEHDSVPASATAWQWLTHAFLLHGVLGVDSLSAGVWYVAIDFQLFALLLVLLWIVRLAGLGAREAVLGVTLLVLASLFFFNRISDWDVWALYFFGAYGLGALAFWASRQSSGTRVGASLLALGLITLTALLFDFRSRIALALVVALLLGWAKYSRWITRWPQGSAWAFFGKISYGVFLLNFPVALVVNALFTRFVAPDPWLQTVGVVCAWMACNVAGALFYLAVEARLLPHTLQRFQR